MTDQLLTIEQQRAAWQRIEYRIAALDWAPPVSREQIERLRAQMQARMPARGADEPLADWLRRGLRPASAGTAPAARPGARIIPFLTPPLGRFRPLGQALAWAAAEAGDGPPALPERIEIGTGAFRIGFATGDGNIHVTLEALGFTLVRLAGQTVAVTGPDGLTQLIAQVTLNARGEGAFKLADSADTRRLLLRLQVGEIEPS